MDTRGNEREVLDRVRRIETRVVQLADHMGLDVRDKPSLRIVRRTPTVVVARSLDVSVSRVINLLREEGIVTGDVEVMVQGQVCTAFIINLDNIK